jgi:site-specific recombinase XerC
MRGIPQADRIQVTVDPGTGGVVVYDLVRKEVVNELVDYGIYLERSRQLKSVSISQTLWTLAQFWSRLRRLRKDVLDITTSFLVTYRDEEFKLVKSDRSHRGSDRAVKRTVNGKLSMLLHWLAWLQRERVLPAETIGPIGCSVHAEALRSSNPVPQPDREMTSSLFFRGAGRGPNRPYASRDVFETATQLMVEEAYSPYIAHRNSTFADLAANGGFRRGSICSLKAGQFTREKLESWTDASFDVRPQKQKLDYENTFDISIDLALRVLDFIEGPRADLVERLQLSAARTQDRIFLSSTTGKPMSDRGMTQALSPMMRAAGTNKGQVIHVLRGLYASEMIEQESDDRSSRGLDTSTASIAAATALKLGQANPNSLFEYVAAEQSRIGARRRSQSAKAKLSKDSAGKKKGTS